MRRSALDEIVGETAGFALRFVELAEQGAPELGLGLLLGVDDRSQCRTGLLQAALLHGEILFVLGELLQGLQIGEARAELLVDEILADIDPLADQRRRSFELLDRGGGGVVLGLFLRPLAVERRDLGAMLLDLLGKDKRCIFTCAGLASAGG